MDIPAKNTLRRCIEPDESRFNTPNEAVRGCISGNADFNRVGGSFGDAESNVANDGVCAAPAGPGLVGVSKPVELHNRSAPSGIWDEQFVRRRSVLRPSLPVQSPSFSSRPLFHAGLIIFDAEATTSAEAIRLAAEHLFIAGRTDNARQIEEALWQREVTGPTGIGDGFAIPHCRTGAVIAHSIVIIKPRLPLAWNSTDSQKVELVITLIFHEKAVGAEAMTILSGLARLLMQSDCRQRLKTEADPHRLADWLEEKLGA